jgi:hypothetical protein
MLTIAAALALVAGDRPEVARWMQCLADEAALVARSGEPADIAADAAMGACAGQEGALIAVELNGVAGAARERVERAQSDGRGVVRQRVIARIVEIRSAR